MTPSMADLLPRRDGGDQRTQPEDKEEKEEGEEEKEQEEQEEESLVSACCVW